MSAQDTDLTPPTVDSLTAALSEAAGSLANPRRTRL